MINSIDCKYISTICVAPTYKISNLSSSLTVVLIYKCDCACSRSHINKLIGFNHRFNSKPIASTILVFNSDACLFIRRFILLFETTSALTKINIC